MQTALNEIEKRPIDKMLQPAGGAGTFGSYRQG